MTSEEQLVMSNDLYGVILAGGSGSRLWPLSREMFPKQLLKINNNDETLFQSAFTKLVDVVDDKNIISVTNVKQESAIKMQLDELQTKFCRKKKYTMLTEPIGKNTAPAIALCAKFIRNNLPTKDPVLVITPSDHIIDFKDKYIDALNEAKKLAEKGFLAILGVQAKTPDTGFGYIKTIEDDSIHDISKQALKVKEFKEKPDLKTAKRYIKSGNYFWNAGIFVAKVSVLLKELETYCPEITSLLENVQITENSPSIEYNIFEKMQDISFDYAVMEKSKKTALVPLDCGWHDLGSWEAIYESSPKDDKGNFIAGNAKTLDCQNSVFYSTSKLMTAIGLKNTIVVETEDALLVCNRANTQDVKNIYHSLKQENNDAFSTHKTVYRPWGYYTVMDRGDGFMTKCIGVNAGGQLSLQRHKHRSEHWVVLEGKAKVILNGDEHILSPGESIDIGVMEIHSLQNPYKERLKILEVQKGDILEETDIERLQDIYGRT